MNAPLTEQVLVVISSPPSLESQIVDWLLSNNGSGFSSTAIHGHSTRHDHLSIAEQVSGRQKRIQFQVQMSAGDLDGFLGTLEGDFAGADLHYWALPLLAGGHLG
jgi:Protein of unknown function (DUF3240)